MANGTQLGYHILATRKLTLKYKPMEKISCLTFSVGKEYFAINIKNVREVLFHQYYSTNCDPSQPYAGTISLRGKQVPLIDAHCKLFLNKNGKRHNHTVIVFETPGKSGHNMLAASVFSVDEVLEIETKDISPIPFSYDTHINPMCVDGVVKHHNNHLFIVNPEKFLIMPTITRQASQPTKSYIA
jgi:purine-binding chemotaxis protein CheW